MSPGLFFNSDRSSNDVLAGSPSSFQRWKRESRSIKALSRYSTPQLPQSPRERPFGSKHSSSDAAQVDSSLKKFALGPSLLQAISESIRNGNELRKTVETTIRNAVNQAIGIDLSIGLEFVQQVLAKNNKSTSKNLLNTDPDTHVFLCQLRVEDLSYDLTLVQKELDKEAQRKRNMSNDDRSGALDLAASFGASPIVRLLLQHDRSIAVCAFTSLHRSNAMVLAAEHGHEGAVYELVSSGPVDPKPWSYAIRKAVLNGFEGVALMLAQQERSIHDAQGLLWVEEANNLFLQAAGLEGNQRLMAILLSKYPISAEVLSQSLKHFCNYGNEMLATMLEALVQQDAIERGFIEVAVEAGAGHGDSIALQLLLNCSSISLSSRGKAARSAAFHGNEQALIVLRENGSISDEDLDFALAVAKTMDCANILKNWKRFCAIQ